MNGERASGTDVTGGHCGRSDGADVETDADPVALGVELLRKFEGSELSVAAAVDRIETITTDPAITREILERAEVQGVIEREAGVIRPQGSGFVRFESEVISKEGEFTCRRCGTGITEGYFIRLDAGEHGPFGSSCIRTVTGRERD